MKPVAEKESWLAGQRAKRPWLDHLVRAKDEFTARNGNHYAAAITYFSVLSLFPLLMIAFSVVGFVLAGNPTQLENLKETITDAVPSGLVEITTDLVDAAIESRGTVGVLGLLIAAYSGLGWMSNLRDALTAQWGIEYKQVPILRRTASDLLSLLGLGLALAISFGLTAAGSGLGSLLLDWIGLEDDAWAVFLLRAATIVLALTANWVVFVWVISRLPREKVSARSAVRGAIAAAIGFEILKQAASLFLASVTASPAGAVFGPIMGLLVFANLVARYLLFITAWTATARENLIAAMPNPPPPAVIRPVLQVRTGPRARDAAGLLGAGALLGLLWRKRSRPR
ncbi:inner membrane protein YhjD [Actinophytocola sp.]|uniref:inner membrane protein YhjD n=1 Tax=Actinophytocola sp. TaxID=1872138 RepID=UPI003D6A2E88